MRLTALFVAALLAACDSRPPVTPAPSPQTPQPTASEDASARPTPTIAPSQQPTFVTLPAGFDAIPWARMPVSADTDPFVVTFGVLGKQATGTRSFEHQPTVWADGPAILMEVDGLTEIVNAATGQTIATYDRNALRLPGVPEDNWNYFLFSSRFRTDVARRFLYDLASNRQGVQLRRFNLDGSHETLLAKVAPDPGRDAWYADFAITETGTVVATACPTDRALVADFRCRLYEAEPGAPGPLKPRFLPASAARPCSVQAASGSWLAAISYEYCRADGGPPQIITYMSLDLTTLKTTEIEVPVEIAPFGLEEQDGAPILVGNLRPALPIPAVYPSIGVAVRLTDPWYSIDSYVHEPEGNAPNPYPNYVWSIAGRGPGWTLLNGYAPTYAICRIDLGLDSLPSACSPGPLVLVMTDGSFELPPGTWGPITPPAGVGGA